MSKPLFSTSGWKLPTKIVVDKKDEPSKPNNKVGGQNKGLSRANDGNRGVKSTHASNITVTEQKKDENNAKKGNNKGNRNEGAKKTKFNKNEAEGKPKKKGNKRMHEDKKGENENQVETKDIMEEDGFQKVVRHNKKKVKDGSAKKQFKKSEDHSKQTEVELNLEIPNTNNETSQIPSSKPKKENKLSVMQAKMAEKLKGSKFRILNEELYTNDSTHSLSTFKENPELFDIYHEGFRSQVKSWPTNPVDVFVNLVKSMDLSKKRVVDLGCGDAQLSKSLGPSVMVFSFDLVATQPEVIACDCTNLPVETKSVDVVVISLALMATNYYEMLNESSRILKVGGELYISEVSSRFEKLDPFIEFVESLGFTLKKREEDNPYFVIMIFTRSTKKFITPKLNEGFKQCYSYTLNSNDLIPKSPKENREIYEKVVFRYRSSIEKCEAVHNLYKKKGLSAQARYRFSVEPPKLKACAYKRR